jgi:phosphate transport system permease protein
LAAATSVLVILAVMIVRTTLDAWPVFRREGHLGFVTGDPVERRDVAFRGHRHVRRLAVHLRHAEDLVLRHPCRRAPRDRHRAVHQRDRATVVAQAARSTVDMLAMVPSVVYALVGIYFFRLHIWAPVGQLIADSPLGNIRSSAPRCCSSYWSAANILAIMILPIITAICRETFAQVPRDERTPPTRWARRGGR